ncbi:hypothetical protein [Bradyrhizobium arachidis]|uniref:Uncharacterized protein n=1 Tax=Bradyrhizobium arachidis TaxID=858423 RepID=A0AAE7TIP6_9BRAD|nr:hypothetical protein [Bradyrhizobium arachidis]QOZ69131.1 hypothetical protein WN72_24530 [Bradyrhizobium arachidis]
MLMVMKAERSPLEHTLRDTRKREKRHSTFNQHHRQLLDRLRDVEWVASSKLEDRPKTKLTLIRNGWMEMRSSATGIEYHITEAGLAALTQPRLKTPGAF